MTLGPAYLKKEPIENIINKKEFKKIIKEYDEKKIKWNNKKLKPLKDLIRKTLRKEQEYRCIYCRRIIKIERKNTTEDIEHFLDKSKSYYRKWSFSPVNLALSCHSCNMEKSTIDLGDENIQTATSLTANTGNYKWIHPYFHNYHKNIKIHQGWIYNIKKNAPNYTQARNLIKECKLDEIHTIEKNAENIKKKILELTIATSIASLKGNQKLVEELIKESIIYQTSHYFDH